ncbi:glutathione S-transferase family protein [Xanthobacter autotrophicus]|uniref:glutathione S-transferase family protein n=1 Tax=Xanthobacter autotrophicus TaxID=280 RepID=UPI0024A68263|nr:glutathione S-transferase family protein [Xanthobacter autotrophicus]MDI4656815.1 glutathione S-transferase family protein [Xanthobacter autotrophicus]
MLTLYSTQASGNSYKARLMLAQLGRPFRLVEVDIFAGENRTPEFLARNPEGRVPLLEVDGRFLAESNAILFYLAEGTRFLPTDAFDRAEVLRWMFFEQHSHEPGIAAARFWLRQVRGGRELRTHDVDRWMEEGYAALKVMERHLAGRRFFVGATLTIADMALYAHTHVAEEGDFSLQGFPAVRAWLARVAAEPDHVDMEWRPSVAAA